MKRTGVAASAFTRVLSLFAAFALLFAATPCVAGESPPEDPNAPIHAGTEHVTVTGEGAKVDEAPTSFVTVIRVEEFSWRFASLADLLDESVGVRVRSYGGLNSFATVSVRGSQADQVAIFLDGVPINSPLGGGVNLADIPLAGVEALEIHRGFTPAYLGASSIGGAINIRTQRPGTRSGGSASLSLGSYGTGGLTALAGWGSDRLRWSASSEASTTEGDFTYLDDNGTSLTPADDRERVRVNNASWSAAARVRADAPFSAGRAISITADWLRRSQGVPGIDAMPSETATFDLERGLLRAEAMWQGLASGSIDAEASIDYQSTSQEFENADDPTSPYPHQDTLTRVSGPGARLWILWRAAAAHRVSFLMEPRWQEADVRNRLHGSLDPLRVTRASFSCVTEDELRLAGGRFLLAPSLRYDLNRDAAGGGTPGSRPRDTDGGAALSGRIGGFFAISPHWSLRGNVGRFYRVPSLLDRFGDAGAIAGNPDLRPEEGINADIGVGIHGASAGRVDRITAEIAAFRTDAEDLIQLWPISNNVLKPMNVSRARITGVEASTTMRFFGRVTASANYTRMKPKTLEGTFASGSDLPFRPRVAADTSLSIDLGKASIFHRFSYVGENDIAFPGNLPPVREALAKLPARYLHDAGVRAKLGKRLEGSFEVINILDRHVVDVARYPLPGRMIVGRIASTF